MGILALHVGISFAFLRVHVCIGVGSTPNTNSKTYFTHTLSMFESIWFMSDGSREIPPNSVIRPKTLT